MRLIDVIHFVGFFIDSYCGVLKALTLSLKLNADKLSQCEQRKVKMRDEHVFVHAH